METEVNLLHNLPVWAPVAISAWSLLQLHCHNILRIISPQTAKENLQRRVNTVALEAHKPKKPLKLSIVGNSTLRHNIFTSSVTSIHFL